MLPDRLALRDAFAGWEVQLVVVETLLGLEPHVAGVALVLALSPRSGRSLSRAAEMVAVRTVNALVTVERAVRLETNGAERVAVHTESAREASSVADEIDMPSLRSERSVVERDDWALFGVEVHRLHFPVLRHAVGAEELVPSVVERVAGVEDKQRVEMVV